MCTWWGWALIGGGAFFLGALIGMALMSLLTVSAITSEQERARREG